MRILSTCITGRAEVFWYDMGKCGSHGGRDLCLQRQRCFCYPNRSAHTRWGDVCEKHGSQCRTSAFFMVILSSILSGCVAAFAGPVSFVGIAVPHLIRWLFADTRPLVLIPGCFLGGSVFCLFSDWLARTVFAPDGIEHQHGNSCLWCAGRDFCDDAETSKEHLKRIEKQRRKYHESRN